RLVGEAGLLRHVQVAGEDPVQDGRHREADERGDVGAAESGATGYGPGEHGRAHERDHGGERDPVRGQAAPAPPVVHAVRLEDLLDRVVALADEEEVDQVDGGPGDHEVQ